MEEEKVKNTPIEIAQVNNGFEVLPGLSSGYNDPAVGVDHKNKHVYESLSGLINFLKNHFDHRNQDVIHD